MMGGYRFESMQTLGMGGGAGGSLLVRQRGGQFLRIMDARSAPPWRPSCPARTWSGPTTGAYFTKYAATAGAVPPPANPVDPGFQLDYVHSVNEYSMTIAAPVDRSLS